MRTRGWRVEAELGLRLKGLVQGYLARLEAVRGALLLLEVAVRWHDVGWVPFCEGPKVEGLQVVRVECWVGQLRPPSELGRIGG